MGDTPLVEHSLLQLFLQHWIYPTLYSPFKKLSEYFYDNHHLFTLLGVFGAVTIYARNTSANLDIGQGTAKLIIGPGFGIVILISIVTFADSVRRMRTAKSYGSFENWGLIAFNLLFLPIVGSLAVIASQPNVIWTFYLFFISWLGPFFLMLLLMAIVGAISKYTSEKLNVSPYITLFISLIAMLFTAAYLFPEDGGNSLPASDPLTFSLADWGGVFIDYTFAWGVFVPLLLMVTLLGLLIFGTAKSAAISAIDGLREDDPNTAEGGE